MAVQVGCSGSLNYLPRYTCPVGTYHIHTDFQVTTGSDSEMSSILGSCTIVGNAQAPADNEVPSAYCPQAVDKRDLLLGSLT